MLRATALALGVGLALGRMAGAAELQQEDQQEIANPPALRSAAAILKSANLLESSATRPRLNLLTQPLMTELAPGVPREVELNLSIRYVNGWIRNPSVERPGAIKYDRVRLRSYVQGDSGPARSIAPDSNWAAPGQTVFVAPQIEAYPGQTVRITLNNNLPADPSCIAQGGSGNIPHCFNGTNLHSHGLWVNPAGNSDNVLISINPGVGFQYEYNIPPTHPAGTFWYHTHRHGSTALQVSSGMAGALIVRGTRAPTPAENGDIDTLLKSGPRTQFPERVLVFQQIQYACRFQSGPLQGKIKTYGNDPGAGLSDPTDQRYKCDDGDIGQIDGYDQFGPGSWQGSGRYTSINGVVLGKLARARTGVIERWRMIHGGVRDTISFKIKRRAFNAPPISGLRASATEDYVNQYCTGPELDLPLIAADGLTLAKAMPRKAVVFQPAYRWDALVVFPQPGDYCVINDVKVASSVDRAAPSARLLGLVEVGPGTPVRGDSVAYVKARLVAAAQANLPASVSPKVVAELNDGFKLSSFVPHRTIDAAEVTGTQLMTFNIDTSKPGSTTFQVDGRPFDGNRIDRTLQLGAVDEWTLASDFVSHPFHIHVNPFQIVKILTPDGVDISGDDGRDPDGDSQYVGLKNVWKDTLWVKNLFASNDPAKARQGRYTIVVRTRYERYIGDFVLHCHILDHEDQGMMQNIRVALPDGNGGTAAAHH
ncbi:multicopper oxidase family protein [Janthinobacterium agaricidamnosum NBRC 102515 = DSM 9628]|uniref:Multicopper oxidase family protein n=1 Tax=Janthinobacterium agaricidamnosum NBRC 102515 = DSM 9628 TaxID=1349767 RepID=W0V4K4_9BURK|nr:multicopper oxidase family protein [Janthinobacterium agaricidamnosum NBRC 102515 = DSM 9628]